MHVHERHPHHTRTTTPQGLIVDGSHPWEAVFSPARPPPLKSLAELVSEAEHLLTGYAKRVRCSLVRVCAWSVVSHVLDAPPAVLCFVAAGRSRRARRRVGPHAGALETALGPLARQRTQTHARAPNGNQTHVSPRLVLPNMPVDIEALRPGDGFVGQMGLHKARVCVFACACMRACVRVPVRGLRMRLI